MKENDIIRVLVVEDSATARRLLTGILESDPCIEVVGIAVNGEEALRLLKNSRLKPDVITMDINMPIMDGYETTQRIVSEYPIPVVVVSSAWDPTERMATFKALEVGATGFCPKPGGLTSPTFEKDSRKLIRTVKLMSEVKVVRRRSRTQCKAPDFGRATKQNTDAIVGKRVDLVAIGASTGGPPVLREILLQLPVDTRFAVLISQHISGEFSDVFIRWLDGASAAPVHKAIHGEHILAGHVYVAPGGENMAVTPSGEIYLSVPTNDDLASPSVDILFESVGNIYCDRAVGVLLTGMGRDGAIGLAAMQKKGALTIAQDEESCVVFGMPKEAIAMNAAMLVLSEKEISAMLACIAKGENCDGIGVRGQ